ncbi:MAG: hypothetical protein ACRCX2_01830 [Paraclostridium sp.]
MARVRFGLNDRQEELKNLLTRREFLVKAANPLDKIDALLEDYSDMLFDPKKMVKLSVINTKDVLVESDVKEREEILNAQEKFRLTSPIFDLIAHVQTVLDGKKAKLVRINKKIEGFNGKKEDKVMSYLPGDLRELYKIKELTTARIPVSILRAIVELETLELTGEEVLKLHFVSVTCDKYTGNYEQHLWSLTYDVSEEIKLTKEEIIKFNNIEDEML